MKPDKLTLAVLGFFALIGGIVAYEWLGIHFSKKRVAELCRTLPVARIFDAKAYKEWTDALSRYYATQDAGARTRPTMQQLSEIGELSNAQRVTKGGIQGYPFQYPYDGVRVTRLDLLRSNIVIFSFYLIGAQAEMGPIQRGFFGDVGARYSCFDVIDGYKESYKTSLEIIQSTGIPVSTGRHWRKGEEL